MRNEFADALVELAENDPRVVLLTGDLGFMVLECFSDRFPDRFFNVGVAEQNMLGIATGLADSGYVPFVYSIATFVSMRPYEFLRNGAILHDLPIRVVGVGGGFDYGHNGVTHFALEDVGILRVQPGLTVIAPADAGQARSALFATADLARPIYFRVAREDAPVPGLDGRFALGRVQVIGDGDDLAIVTLGTMAAPAVVAADVLAEEGINAIVVVVPTFNPTPIEDLVDTLGRVPLALTAEAHYVTGGVGSVVAEVIAEHGLHCRLVRCGVTEMPKGISGSQEYLSEIYGLTAQDLVRTAQRAARSQLQRR